MSEGKDNRTERPTAKRLQKAREKGQVARSKEIPSAVVLLGVLGVLYYYGESLTRAFQVEMRSVLRLQLPAELTVSYMSTMLRGVSLRMGVVLAPVMLSAMALGLAANVMQGGLTVSWHAMGLHFDKLSPKNGFQKFLSKSSLAELVKSAVVLVFVSIISYRVVSQYWSLYPRLVIMDVGQLLYWTATISYEVLLRVAVVLVLIAIADYAFQKYRFLDQLKMTKQEVKQEFKDTDGDPLIRGRIRRIQRELSRKRMMAEVPKADVVITNPTHYAVALAYKVESMEAPEVVAKGVGFLAVRIKELAQEHHVPLVENKALAQALYKTVEVGASIPATLYRAVAEILAYIYKTKNAWK